MTTLVILLESLKDYTFNIAGVTTSNYSGAIKQYNGSNYYWWLRSAGSRDTIGFFFVGNNGFWVDDYSSTTVGVSPAFRIG